MKIIEIAEEIHRDLGAPTAPSQGNIGFWLRENIGMLNNTIGSSYSIASYEISPELGQNEKAIYKRLYFIDYYERLIRQNMGAASFDTVLEVTSDGATVRKVNKNEISKTFLQLKKDVASELAKLINGYKLGSIIPQQVAGDDYIGYEGTSSDEERS